MAKKKTIFVAFAIEDESQRNLLKGQSKHIRSPFEYIDLSVREAYRSGWKGKVRTRIRRSHGVIALVSRKSLSSEGQKWEIACAKEEGKPILGLRAYSEDRTSIPGIRTRIWKDKTIKRFIDNL